MQLHSFATFAGCVALGVSCVAHGQGASYPTRAVRIVSPFPAGGSSDYLARAIAKYLGEHWRQSAFVENRPGAGGTIGTEVIAKAPADGYHYIMGSMTTHAINASLYRRLPFDVVRDFTPISSVADLQAVLVVHPSVPVKTISELLRIAKAKPEKLTYGSAGNGSIAHMTTVLFQNTTGTRLLHVPFKGDAPAIIAMTGGQIDMMFATLPAAIGQIRGGRLKAIAVSGPKRSPAIPDLPTVSESGVPGFHVTAWFGLFAPANLPREITQKMNADLVGILRRQDLRDGFAAQGAEATGNTAEEFAAHVRKEVALWAKVVESAGVKLD